MNGGPCRTCGIVHKDPPDPGVVVRVKDGKYAGAVGTVFNWSIYGSPLYVRVAFPAGELRDEYTRENFDPCQLEVV